MARKVETLTPKAAGREAIAMLKLRARLSLLHHDDDRKIAAECCDKLVEVLFAIRDGSIN
jgi:hypothetical protein